MAVRHFVNQTNKLRATILTVSISRGLVEARSRDGAIRQIAGFETATVFRWPKEGEEWAIYEENGYWKLGGRFLNDEERRAVADMGEGDFERGRQVG